MQHNYSQEKHREKTNQTNNKIQRKKQPSNQITKCKDATQLFTGKTQGKTDQPNKKCIGQTTTQPNKKFTDATQLFTGKPQEKNQPTK